MVLNSQQESPMHAPQISFFDWQRQFATEEACLRHLTRVRWPDGFQCPSCGYDHGCFLKSRGLYECTHCARQTSVTAGFGSRKYLTGCCGFAWNTLPSGYR